MKVHPMTFTPGMVRAILGEQKCQTRRILGVQPRRPMIFSDFKPDGSAIFRNPSQSMRQDVKIPIKAGDLIYVREPWRSPLSQDGKAPREMVASCLDAGYRRAWNPIQYEADETRENWNAHDWGMEVGKFRQAMHMPRPYTRATLEVTEVKVERLQDIRTIDAAMEGANFWFDELPIETKPMAEGSKPRFRALWESIHGPEAWGANPWVYAPEFKLHRKNIDDLIKERGNNA